MLEWVLPIMNEACLLSSQILVWPKPDQPELLHRPCNLMSLHIHQRQDLLKNMLSPQDHRHQKPYDLPTICHMCANPARSLYSYKCYAQLTWTVIRFDEPPQYLRAWLSPQDHRYQKPYDLLTVCHGHMCAYPTSCLSQLLCVIMNTKKQVHQSLEGYIRWSLSIVDTLETAKSVLISEVSTFQW